MGQSQLLSDHVFHTGANAGKDVPAKEPSSRRTVWRDIATRFIEPRECLASFLALESAEVVAGIKPANLFPIPNRTYACGRNPYQLWKKWGKTVVATTPLEAYELTDRGDSVLLLLYRPDALANLLEKPAVRAILARAGYASGVALPQVLDRFARCLAAGAFPHEIGIFLGYPLKDVVGFMGLARIPFTCQGPWKIYGEPQASLCLAETFRCCRSRMAADLSKGASPSVCLTGSSSSNRLAFSSLTENNIQDHRQLRSLRIV